MIGEPSAIEIDGGTEVGVGGSGEIEVNGVEVVSGLAFLTSGAKVTKAYILNISA